MVLLKKVSLVLSAFLLSFPLVGRNTILEFRGAYFLPIGHIFKDIYNGSALYGPELTLQCCKEGNLYAFASVNYLNTKGHSIGAQNPTTVTLLPLTFGAKYFMPLFCEKIDVYLGLGFEAMRVHTKDVLPDLVSKKSKWGFGGITKIGAYCYLPYNFLIDIFIDYSFIKAGSNSIMQPSTGFQSIKANVSGVIFGGGLGYRF